MQRSCRVLMEFAFLLAFFSSMALGQTNSYTQKNLVSDAPGMAAHTDANLINPWGVAYFPNNPFWISDNNAGVSTLYDQNGNLAGTFTIPPPAGSSNPSTPTGIVANLSGTGFAVNGKPGVFIFDTEDGTISSWNGSDPVTLTVDNSKSGAVYKGLALLTNGSGTFLLAANFNSGKVDVFDPTFHSANLSGNLTDPTLPAGFAPFGIHILNGNQILVTYAMQDAAKHDPIHQAGAGYVSLFDQNGVFVRRVASQGTLNAPWGAVIPPQTFGAFKGDLLIGNFGDGTINAFDFSSGNFIDQMKDANGAAITNASLWDMVFGGGGSSGDPNTLYITAGLANEQHGLFAAVTPNAGAPPAADFSISASPSSENVAAGQSASFMVTVAALNGFNSSVAFSCSGEPAGSACSFSPASITPSAGGMATTAVTISTHNIGHYGMTTLLLPSAHSRGSGPLAVLLLLAAMAFVGLRRSPRQTSGPNLPNSLWLKAAGCLAFLVLFGGLLFAAGCGGGSMNPGTGTPRGTTTVMITGTSGSITHSASVNLSVQ